MSESQWLLQAEGIGKRFRLPDGSSLTVLENLALTLESGASLAITGASGSGKSTLLHLIGSLDRPDEGDILFEGESILKMGTAARSRYRNRTVGFVYQFHHLMPELSVLENVAFPFLLSRFDRGEAFSRAERLLDRVGLAGKLGVMPQQLSGGERQRVAIARALINSPRLLLADEPTGNLDWKTGERVFSLFRELIAEFGLTAVVVTHNTGLAALLDRRLELHSGRLFPGDA